MPPKKAVGKAVQKVKKVVETVRHRPFIKTHINAQMASPAPPLGTQLASRQVMSSCAWEKRCEVALRYIGSASNIVPSKMKFS